MTLSTLRRSFEPAIRWVLHRYWRLSRGLTVGVRALVVDGSGRVFLVEHSYVEGWHLPGGGVEAGETLLDALARELKEEGNIDITAPARLHGIYFNRRISNRDHVALYVVEAFEQVAVPVPDHEIIGHGFFALDALPEGTTRATRARIAEVLQGAPRSEWW